jgi:hypothetical protein
MSDLSNAPPARTVYVVTAWASSLVAVLISVVFWIWVTNHVGMRGQRSRGVLLFSLVLLLTSVAGVLAAAISLFGIRSRRSALLIVPGALLGICINGYNAVMWFLAYALEGTNPSG